MQSFSQDRLQDYMSTNDASFTYLNFSQVQNTSGWNIGESSSSFVQNLVNHNEQNGELVWASSVSDASGVPPVADHGPTLLQNFAPLAICVHQDQNINVGFEEQGSDDCQIVECPPIFKCTSANNARLSSSDSFPNPIEINVGGHAKENDGLESHHLSRKRKAMEGNIGQSSENGSSNYFEHAQGSAWHVVPHRQNASSNLSISSSLSGNASGNSQMDHLNPRFQHRIGVVSESPPTLSATGVSESLHRNSCLSFTSLHQLDFPLNDVFAVENANGPSNHLSPHLPPYIPRLGSPLDMSSLASTNSGVPQGQSHLSPVVLRNLQSSRRNRTSSSRTSSSSSSAIAVDNNRDSASFGESMSRSMQRHVLDHPMFIPVSGLRNSARSQTNWNIGGFNDIARNVSSNGPTTDDIARNVSSIGPTTDDIARNLDSNGPTAGANPSSAPNVVSNRNSLQYSQRLSELVRRSLLSSSLPGSRGQITNLTNSPTSAQGMAISSDHGDHLSHSRSATFLDRHLGGSLGFPHSLRALASTREGRRRFLSEIRNVLDQMRRGEGLRFEDVMMLDQSGFFGMVDGVYDRHRDMRLDVDNMSYEELLALGDRIGYVNTGLNEQAISKCVKKRKYTIETNQKESEPCCICQEEYIVGDNLGKLDCEHDFHTKCIKEWLTHKNMCPICKTTTVDTKEKS